MVYILESLKIVGPQHMSNGKDMDNTFKILVVSKSFSQVIIFGS